MLASKNTCEVPSILIRTAPGQFCRDVVGSSHAHHHHPCLAMASRVWPRIQNPGTISSSVATSSLLNTLDNPDEDFDTMTSVSINDDLRAASQTQLTAQSRSPYLHPAHQATASTSTFNNPQLPNPTALTAQPGPSSPTPTPTAPGTPRITASRKSSSLRHVSNAPPPAEPAQSIKRRPSSPSAKDGKHHRNTREQRIRTNPRLPHSDDVPIAPATNMYWSRAPVHGTLPMHNMRAHTVTLVDNVAWVFGGCDDKGCWRDIYCLDTGKSPSLRGPSPTHRSRIRYDAVVSPRVVGRDSSPLSCTYRNSG